VILIVVASADIMTIVYLIINVILLRTRLYFAQSFSLSAVSILSSYSCVFAWHGIERPKHHEEGDSLQAKLMFLRDDVHRL